MCFMTPTYAQADPRNRGPCSYKSNQPVFLQILCIDADNGLRDLARFLKQTLDVFPDGVGFKIHGVVHLLEQRSVVSSMVLSESKVTLPARLDDRR